MTRTVKLETGGLVALTECDGGVMLREYRGDAVIELSPRDVGRLIAALSRTQAARRDRRATPVGPREAR
jgi:hypothetical protein